MKSETTFTDRQTHNYGIDLLRIISIWMVVVLHLLSVSGLLNVSHTDAGAYAIAYGVQAFCICAVNVFALTSGYVCSQQKFRLNRVLRLWLQVFFYSFVFFFVNIVIYNNFTVKNLIRSFFPVLTDKFWYFTAYFLLMFLMPVFNIVIAKVEKKQYVLWLGIIGICFSLATMVFEIWQIYAGYTWIWLAYLYFVGAYLKKFGCPIRNKGILLAAYILLSLFIVGLHIAICRLGFVHRARMFYFYSSIFVLIQSIALFALFVGVNISGRFKQTMRYIASLTFGIYLSHSYLISYANHYSFIRIAERSTLLYIPLTIAYAVVIFVASSVIEALRQLFFKWCHINKVSDRFAAFLQNKFD